MTAAYRAEKVGTVERIVRVLEAGTELSTEERRAIADALRNLTLPAPRHAERDRLLIECRRQFYGNHTDHSAAQEIAAAWGRYESVAWVRDRSCDSCPPRHIGTPREFFWAMLRACPRSLSADRIRKILGRVEVTNT